MCCRDPRRSPRGEFVLSVLVLDRKRVLTVEATSGGSSEPATSQHATGEHWEVYLACAPVRPRRKLLGCRVVGGIETCLTEHGWGATWGDTTFAAVGGKKTRCGRKRDAIGVEEVNDRTDCWSSTMRCSGLSRGHTGEKFGDVERSSELCCRG